MIELSNLCTSKTMEEKIGSEKMDAVGAMSELQMSSINKDKIVEEIVKMERKIFPKHESLARSFDSELRKKNGGLIYTEVDGKVAGYVMYSWTSSLSASITKLAGRNLLLLHLQSR